MKLDFEYLKYLIKTPISRGARNWIKNYYKEIKIKNFKLFMTLLVKNEEDIIETNIRFHKAMGVDGFIVTSHNSTDKTNKILEKLKEDGIVSEIIYEKSNIYKQSEFVDKMIKLAKNKSAKALIVLNGSLYQFIEGIQVIKQYIIKIINFNISYFPPTERTSLLLNIK